MQVTLKVHFELTLDLDASYKAGRPETPPAYDHGGLPAEDPEVEVIGLNRVLVDNQQLELSPDLRDKILQAVLQNEHLADKIDLAVLDKVSE